MESNHFATSATPATIIAQEPPTIEFTTIANITLSKNTLTDTFETLVVDQCHERLGYPIDLKHLVVTNYTGGYLPHLKNTELYVNCTSFFYPKVRFFDVISEKETPETRAGFVNGTLRKIKINNNKWYTCIERIPVNTSVEFKSAVYLKRIIELGRDIHPDCESFLIKVTGENVFMIFGLLNDDKRMVYKFAKSDFQISSKTKGIVMFPVFCDQMLEILKKINIDKPFSIFSMESDATQVFLAQGHYKYELASANLENITKDSIPSYDSSHQRRINRKMFNGLDLDLKEFVRLTSERKSSLTVKEFFKLERLIVNGKGSYGNTGKNFDVVVNARSLQHVIKCSPINNITLCATSKGLLCKIYIAHGVPVNYIINYA